MPDFMVENIMCSEINVTLSNTNVIISSFLYTQWKNILTSDFIPFYSISYNVSTNALKLYTFF